MRLLAVNVGSSSLKLSVLADGEVVAAQTIERWSGSGHLQPLDGFVRQHAPFDAVAHRVVHGGPRHTDPALVDAPLIAYLDSISHLAPLHQPRAVAGILAVRDLLPGVPAVACFDTTFHSTLPAAARTYALPQDWNDRWQLRRYGFHGLSHAHAVRRTAELVGRPVEDLRIVSCHLGTGASLAAVRGREAVDTTMGFTPLAGLVMNTRPGTLDPGLLLWLLEHGRVPVSELIDVLEHHSGLRGLSGTSGDVRDVLAGVAAGDERCELALDVYLHRLCREIAAMTAATEGLDVLVMTGGVGEHAPLVRARVVARLAHLGLGVDPELNETTSVDGDISHAGASVRTLVVTAREDLQMARQVAAALGSPGGD
jgi:acetate kinase